MKIGDKVVFIKDDWECIHKLVGREGTIIAKSVFVAYDFEVQLSIPLPSGTKNWAAEESHLKIIEE